MDLTEKELWDYDIERLNRNNGILMNEVVRLRLFKEIVQKDLPNYHAHVEERIWEEYLKNELRPQDTAGLVTKTHESLVERRSLSD